MADTKHATELESREVAEQAREEGWVKLSFARALFEGRFDLGLVHPHPLPDPEEQARAAPFLEQIEAFARANGKKVLYVLSFPPTAVARRIAEGKR